jgi:hypothetical protein
MKTLITALALILATTTAQATEINLACLRQTSKGLEIRTVIVGDNVPVGTQVKAQSGKIIKTSQFAVVFKTIPGVGNKPASEVWEVLADGQFSLLSGKNGYPYEFKDLKNRKAYDCDYNEEVRANPAITRTN